MDYHFFALMSRMRYIGRWGLMRSVQPENVSEHSHMVAVLAHALAVIENEKFGGALDVGEVAVAALYHDAPEILTGDLPTPVKYYNPEIKTAYKAVEQTSAERLLALLPQELQGIYRPYVSETCVPEVERVVKAADKLSAYIKCVEETKAGNHEFDDALRQVAAALEANPLKSLHYFMDHFLDSFGLTLDQLQRGE
ncbi:MAG: 5'-deoxynucleotidase [Oscillospiraceae bacterium]